MRRRPLEITFRSLPVWPFDPTPRRAKRSANLFRSGYQDTVELLKREVAELGGEAITIMAGFEDHEIRLDGMPRANAGAPRHDGVIVSFESKYGPLSYPTDVHDHWTANLRGIALALQALRAVDRYGVTKTGQQFHGWKQLTAGSGLTSREQAIATLAKLSGNSVETVETAAANQDGGLRYIYRKAIAKAHPDGGGSTDLFASAQDAGRILNVRNGS